MPISLEIQYHSLYYVLFVREWSKGNDYPQAGMRGSKGAWHLIDKQTNESCIFADNLCYNSCQEDFHHILGKMMNFLSKSYSQEGKSKLSYARTAFWIMVIDKKERIFYYVMLAIFQPFISFRRNNVAKFWYIFRF